jgi:hypothetical protein
LRLCHGFPQLHQERSETLLLILPWSLPSTFLQIYFCLFTHFAKNKRMLMTSFCCLCLCFPLQMPESLNSDTRRDGHSRQSLTKQVTAETNTRNARATARDVLYAVRVYQHNTLSTATTSYNIRLPPLPNYWNSININIRCLAYILSI